MSPSKLIPSLLLATLAVGFMAPRAQAQIDLSKGLIINDVDLVGTHYDAQTGQLTIDSGTVAGTLAGRPFTTKITDFALQLVDPATPDTAGCSVLHLALAPIDLDLLGLHVDTGPICLNLTAFADEGLLGSLLCGLAGGNPLGLAGLGDALSEALSGATAATLADADPTAAAPAEDICDGECEILNLTLGPVNLAVLGLHVDLDNCDDGPVQVCLSATASEGLLGGLLCGLTGNGGLLGNLGILDQLLDTLQNALGGANLTAKQATQLVNRLSDQLVGRLADGALSAKDLARVTKTVNQVLR